MLMFFFLTKFSTAIFFENIKFSFEEEVAKEAEQELSFVNKMLAFLVTSVLCFLDLRSVIGCCLTLFSGSFKFS